MDMKKLSFTDVLPMVNNYVVKDTNQIGGNLSMVLSNKNITNENIQFCMNQAKEKDDLEGVQLAKMLLLLSKTQRLKVCHQWSSNQVDI